MLRAHIEAFTHLGSTSATLQNCQLQVDQETIAAIVGPSGAGKTTFLTVLMGVAAGHLRGQISLEAEGRSITPADAANAAWLGHVAQENALAPWLTIGENLLALQALNPNLKAPQIKPSDLLLRVGLQKEVLDLLPHKLSFGMRQRISFLRTLSFKPRFLFLDEAFNGLDSASARMVEQTLMSEVATSRSSCVLVTHDVERACRVAASRYLLTSDGSLVNVTDLSPEEVTVRLEREQASLAIKGLTSTRSQVK